MAAGADGCGRGEGQARKAVGADSAEARRWKAGEAESGGGGVRGGGGAPWRAPMLGVQLIEEMYIEHLHIKFFHQKMTKTSQIAFIKLP